MHIRVREAEGGQHGQEKHAGPGWNFTTAPPEGPQPGHIQEVREKRERFSIYHIQFGMVVTEGSAPEPLAPA